MSDDTTEAKPAPVNPLLRQALADHQAQRLTQAETGYRQVLSKTPDHPMALCLLGILKKDTQQHEEAAVLLAKSIALEPDYADAHGHLGAVYANQQKFAEALSCFDKALSLNPGYLDALRNKALVLQAIGKPEAALDCCRKAIAVSPSPFGLHLLASDLLRQLGNPADAIDHLDRALAVEPRNVEALTRRGALFQERGDTQRALEDLNTALAENGDLPGALVNKGLCLAMLQDYGQAQTCYDRALALAPESPQAHSNKGVLMRLLGRQDEAVEHFRLAIKYAPDYAEAHQNLCFALLNTGNVDEALDEYEWRWRTPQEAVRYRAYEKPLWDGRSDLSDKTILLWPEQGPQDVTIWASAVPDLLSKAGHCILNTYGKLVPLYQRSFPGAEVRTDPGSYNARQDDFDVHLPIGSLFRHLRPDLKPEPRQPAYLHADPERVSFWRQRLESTGPAPYIGVSWKGVITNPMRAPNYTDVKDWAPLIRQSATFVNLQCGDAIAELPDFQRLHGVFVHDFEDLDLFDDLDDVTALSAALDAVVSVSTAVSALAAGVGTPTWIIAWRQSPWHNLLLKSRGPKVTYCERNTGETWDQVFAELSRLPEELGNPSAKR